MQQMPLSPYWNLGNRNSYPSRAPKFLPWSCVHPHFHLEFRGQDSLLFLMAYHTRCNLNHGLCLHMLTLCKWCHFISLLYWFFHSVLCFRCPPMLVWLSLLLLHLKRLQFIYSFVHWHLAGSNFCYNRCSSRNLLAHVHWRRCEFLQSVHI